MVEPQVLFMSFVSNEIRHFGWSLYEFDVFVNIKYGFNLFRVSSQGKPLLMLMSNQNENGLC